MMSRRPSTAVPTLLLALLLLLSAQRHATSSFSLQPSNTRRSRTSPVPEGYGSHTGSLFSSSVTASSDEAAAAAAAAATTQPRGFAKNQKSSSNSSVNNDDADGDDAADDWASNRSVAQLKTELLDLLATMTGTAAEFRRVERIVNALEGRYVPAQTLDFFNLGSRGSWQLLFSTNLAGPPQPQQFRLRQLVQTVSCRDWEGCMDNAATWDLAQAGDGTFDCSGTFIVQNRYAIHQGSRCVIVGAEDDETNAEEEEEATSNHVLRLAKGSNIPQDVPALVGLLHRSMPKTLFDPRDHAVDTTFLDADVRIVRYTGPRHEGVRDIFQRTGSLELE